MANIVVLVTAAAAGKSERTGRHSARNAKDDDDDDDDKCECEYECECEFIAARISVAEIQSPISVRIESDFVAVVVALFACAVDSADLLPPKAGFGCNADDADAAEEEEADEAEDE